MYKAMIVEDEMLVRIGLRNIIDWKALEIELVEDAEDGRKALEIYNREHPDIILTDIRMPEMDGLTLIELIRKQDERCRFMILTCVEDFEIAQKAIAYNVSGYLLKLTMTVDEIQAMICKVVEELKKISKPVSHVRTADMAAVKERFLKDFLFYHSCSGREFAEYVRSYSLKLDAQRHIVGILSLLSYQDMKDQYHDQKGDLVSISILNILHELIESTFSGEVFHDAGPDYVMILNLSSEDEAANQALLDTLRARIQEIMKIYFDTQVLLYFSQPCDDFDHLADAYQQVSKVFRQHFYISQPDTAPQSDTVLLEKLNTVMKQVAENPVLDILLETEEKENYLNLIRTVQQSLPLPNEVRTLFGKLAEMVTDSVCNRMGIYYLDELKSYFTQLQLTTQLETLAVNHQKYLQRLLEQTGKAIRYSPEIVQALSFIAEHYTEEISLKTLADHVHLSSNYFSNLFKKEVGQRFVDYINSLRIEQAKKLLLTSSKRTLEISEETGFADATYFSKVFKKATGISPAEYRRIHTGIEETGS